MPAITCIDDLKRLYKRRVPKMFYDYAETGSWTEQTFRENTSDFDRLYFRQRAGDARLAHRAEPVDPGAADHDAGRAERLGLEDVLTGADAAVEHHLDPVAHRLDDGGEGADRRDRAVELPAAAEEEEGAEAAEAESAADAAVWSSRIIADTENGAFGPRFFFGSRLGRGSVFGMSTVRSQP